MPTGTNFTFEQRLLLAFHFSELNNSPAEALESIFGYLEPWERPLETTLRDLWAKFRSMTTDEFRIYKQHSNMRVTRAAGSKRKRVTRAASVINLPRSGEKTTAVATADLPCVQQEVLSPGETYVTVRFIHDNVTGKSSKMSFENLRLLDRTTASFQLQLCADYKSGPHPDDLLKSGMWFRLGQITDIHSSGKLANNNSFLVTPIDDDAPKPLRIPWKYFSAVEMDADVYLREDDNDVYNDAY